MKPYCEEILNKAINKAINEQNHFWWGCVIGLQYGSLYSVRCNEDDGFSVGVKPDTDKRDIFMPIVKVKYGCPYNNKIGCIHSWFDEENHLPVDLSYLILPPKQVIFETGATKDYINELILFTDNTSSLVNMLDSIYMTQINEQTVDPERFEVLCHEARRMFLCEIGNNFHINKMQYKKHHQDVKDYCTLYVNRFNNWKINHQIL